MTVYQAALVVVDTVLLVLATLRVTRLATTDSIGQWWIYEPIAKRAFGAGRKPKWAKYVDGLQCPYCIGFWIGAIGVGSLMLAGGPGHAALWWRLLAGIFALNWVVGNVASRLD